MERIEEFKNVLNDAIENYCHIYPNCVYCPLDVLAIKYNFSILCSDVKEKLRILNKQL